MVWLLPTGSNLPLLEDAEQLDLQGGRGGVDLVEEDGAAVGGEEVALLVADGAGEGALDVAEELAFEQASRAWRRR